MYFINLCEAFLYMMISQACFATQNIAKHTGSIAYRVCVLHTCTTFRGSNEAQDFAMPWSVNFSDSDSDHEDELLGPAQPSLSVADIGAASSAYVRGQDETVRKRALGAGRPRGSFASRELRQVLAARDLAGHVVEPRPAAEAALASNAAWARMHKHAEPSSSSTSIVEKMVAGNKDEELILQCALRGLPECRRHLKPRVDALVSRALKIADRMWASVPLWSPLSVEAALLNQQRRTLRTEQIALASLLYICSRLVWKAFLGWLLGLLESGELKGELCMSYVIFDETPSKCRLQTPDTSHKGDTERRPLEDKYRQQIGNKYRRPEVAKIFQMEYHIAILVHGRAVGGKYVLLHGELVVPLQHMDRTIAETVHEAIKKGTYVPGWCSLAAWFKLFVNASTADGAGYNRRYKAAIPRLHPEVLKFENECDIHMCNCILGRALGILDHDVSGAYVQKPCYATKISLK